MNEERHPTTGKTALRIILTSCVVGYLATYKFNGMGLGTVIHVSAWIALCSLSGIWFGLGRSIWRIPGVVAIAIITALVTNDFRTGQLALFLLFSLGMILVVGASSFTIRLWYGELQRTTEQVELPDALQFNVRDLLIWTMAIAATVAFCKWLFAQQGDQGLDEVMLVCGLLATLVVTSLVAIWALLGKRLTVARLVSFGMIVALASIMNSILASSQFWLITTIASQIPIIAAIYCLRLQDYRFVKAGLR